MVKKGEIEMLGEEAQRVAIKLKVEGLSHSAIASKLNEKFNANITENQVANFSKRNKNKAFSIMKEKPNFEYNLAKTYFNSLEQMNLLNRELWDFFYNIKKTPELKDKIIKCSHCGRRMVFQAQSYGLLLKTSREILEGIKHVDGVMGKIKGNLTINYNMVDLSQKLQVVIPQTCHELERQGIIKILNKKRLKEKYN